jgi:hypothetical protein
VISGRRQGEAPMPVLAAASYIGAPMLVLWVVLSRFGALPEAIMIEKRATAIAYAALLYGFAHSWSFVRATAGGWRSIEAWYGDVGAPRPARAARRIGTALIVAGVTGCVLSWSDIAGAPEAVRAIAFAAVAIGILLQPVARALPYIQRVSTELTPAAPPVEPPATRLSLEDEIAAALVPPDIRAASRYWGRVHEDQRRRAEESEAWPVTRQAGGAPPAESSNIVLTRDDLLRAGSLLRNLLESQPDMRGPKPVGPVLRLGLGRLDRYHTRR